MKYMGQWYTCFSHIFLSKITFLVSHFSHKRHGTELPLLCDQLDFLIIFSVSKLHLFSAHLSHQIEGTVVLYVSAALCNPIISYLKIFRGKEDTKNSNKKIVKKKLVKDC